MFVQIDSSSSEVVSLRASTGELPGFAWVDASNGRSAPNTTRVGPSTGEDAGRMPAIEAEG